MRRRGLTFAEIGRELKITRPAALHLVRAASGSRSRLVPVYCSRCRALIHRGKRAAWGRQRVLCLACLRKTPDATFAIRLKALRVSRGWTPNELARKSGVTATTIYN